MSCALAPTYLQHSGATYESYWALKAHLPQLSSRGPVQTIGFRLQVYPTQAPASRTTEVEAPVEEYGQPHTWSHLESFVRAACSALDESCPLPTCLGQLHPSSSRSAQVATSQTSVSGVEESCPLQPMTLPSGTTPGTEAPLRISPSVPVDESFPPLSPVRRPGFLPALVDVSCPLPPACQPCSDCSHLDSVAAPSQAKAHLTFIPQPQQACLLKLPISFARAAAEVSFPQPPQASFACPSALPRVMDAPCPPKRARVRTRLKNCHLSSGCLPLPLWVLGPLVSVLTGRNLDVTVDESCPPLRAHPRIAPCPCGGCGNRCHPCIVRASFLRKWMCHAHCHQLASLALTAVTWIQSPTPHRAKLTLLSFHNRNRPASLSSPSALRVPLRKCRGAARCTLQGT